MKERLSGPSQHAPSQSLAWEPGLEGLGASSQPPFGPHLSYKLLLCCSHAQRSEGSPLRKGSGSKVQ